MAEEFLLYKISMGYKYKTGEFYLKSLIKFLVENNQKYSVPKKDFLIAWCQEVKFFKGSMYNRIGIAREFSKFLILKGYDNAYIIPRKYGIKLEKHLPYFFTREEITDFFHSCDHIKRRKENPGRELVIPIIFRLLYCCGLRCKETRTLLCDHVNLEKRYIDILQSKNLKSRRIFINEELANVLRNYEIKISIIFPKRTYFFPKNERMHYGPSFLSANFNRLWKITYPNFDSAIKPRAYDFRHHFAYYNLNRWSAENKDVQQMLIYLMRYMGHAHIKSTLYYFHFVPDFFSTFTEKSELLESILPEVSYETEN